MTQYELYEKQVNDVLVKTQEQVNKHVEEIKAEGHEPQEIDYFLDYEENIDKWLISGYELYKPYYISNVCHKPIKSRKALIRNIRKWNLPKGSIIRWIGEYIGDEMEFKILGKNILKKFN